MAKLSQAAVKELADEWADVGEQIAKLDQKRNAELDPLIERHNLEMKPILDKYDPKIAKLQERRSEIWDEVTGWLTAHGKAISLEGERAVAAVEVKVGARTIDPEKFFKLVKAKGSEFWGCLTVQIAKAEKFLGKTEVDKIAEKKNGLVPTLKLK